MRQQVLLDTGPLVAFLSPQDQFHQRVIAELATIQKPLLTCEAVITETCFLVRRVYQGQERVLSLIAQEFIQIDFSLNVESDHVKELLNRYQSVPMSLADACLVRMAERVVGSSILTFDSDFQIYRKNRNQPIPFITPGQG